MENNIELTKIGEKVKFFRLQKKLTQKELASKIGITHEWVCKIERGKAKNITFSLLVSISKNLDVKLSDITHYKSLIN
jgi:transcriptional regulator with XRE-family HTH domain